MKVPDRKQILLFSFLSIVVLGITIPLNMYLSHNGDELLKGWPHRLTDEDDSVIEIKPTKPKAWSSLSGISPYAQAAIVLSEDWSFFQHEGFDSEQMKVALEEAASGGRVRGASTITQQMVKNVWLTEERSLWRKLHELILAYKVDGELTKKKILEVYLNVIEFGPKIYGITKAARHYFGKSPSQLSPRESAFLAMMLPSPKRYYVSFKKKKLTAFAKVRIEQILVKMRQGKAITPEQFTEEVASRFSWEIP
ncbi:MAG: transglycosylase domain-containing protein [Bacteriovoracaceae bacterium]